MILEISVDNFLSFNELQTLSMVGVKSFKELEESNVFQLPDHKIKVLKAAAIYGNNASGKSNFLDALGFMITFVKTSFKDALDENSYLRIEYKKFLLKEGNEKKPSFFEIIFIANEIKYRYGFEIDSGKVISEWLFHTTSKETYLFKRDNENYKINKSSFEEGLSLSSKTRDNVLFLTLVAQFNGTISSQIINWFQNFNVINGIHDRGYKRFTINQLKEDKKFLNWMVRFIDFLEIANISTEVEEVEEIDIENLKQKEQDEELINLFSTMRKLQEKAPRRDKIITWHRKYNSKNILVDTVPFDFDFDESEGTKKLIYLLGPWYDTIKNGKVLVVDELDSRLHSSLVLRLVKFFQEENKTQAQLIFAIHDTSILNREVLRRDQIWFMNKNQFGESELYSLSDFSSEKVRKKSAFDKNYLSGRYGAIPYFKENKSMLI
jgi:uncharacterized protein